MSLYVAVQVGLSVHIRIPARFHIVPVHRAITNLKTTPQLVAETMHRSSVGRQCRGSRVGVKICSGERRGGGSTLSAGVNVQDSTDVVDFCGTVATGGLIIKGVPHILY